MTYQNPQLLFGLFAIAIPILIHLFNFRKHKTVYFSSIRFLKEIKTNNNRKRNIRNLLILISRIFAITFLVLAFAKPYIPIDKNKTPTNKVFIYIDNSFSMNAISKEGRLLDVAKNKAINITDSYSSACMYYLITNSFLKTHNKGYNDQDFIEAVSNIEATPHYKSLSEIINFKKTISAQEDHIYIISDLQKKTLKIEENNEEAKDNFFIIPIINKKTSNISIDSVWINSPMLINSNNQDIYTIISNFSNQKQEIPISLKVNEKTKIKQLLTIKEGTREELKFRIAIDSAINICQLSINNYPITFDNDIYFNLNKRSKIKILNIKQSIGLDYIKNLYSNDTSNYQYQEASISNLNYKELKEQNVIILNEINELSSGLNNAIINFVNTGGTIIIIPPTEIDYELYKELLTSLGTDYFIEPDTNEYFIKSTQINHPIFNKVFDGSIRNISYPKINYHYKTSSLTQTNKKSLYVLENNSIFLSHYNKDKGNIYLFNTPLNDSMSVFKKHALFVPTFLNIATTSVQQGKIYYTISNNNYFISENNINNKIYHLKNIDSDIVPTTRTINGQTRYYTNNQIFKSGQYKLYDNEKIIDHISYNYNTIESEYTYYNSSELKKYFNAKNTMVINENISNINQLIDNKLNDHHYWKICLLLVLIFFGIEILLLKLIKT